MNDMLLVAGDLILLGAAAASIAFAVSYAFFFRWWKTEAGRSLLAFVVSLDLVFVLNWLGRLIGPDYPGREILRIVVYSFALVASSWLLYTLWRSYHRQGRVSLEIEARERRTGNIPTQTGDIPTVE